MLLTAQDSRTGVATSTTPASLASPLRLAYADRWCLWIAPTTEAVTLVRYRTRGRSDWPWGPWVTATGVTPAAGATGTVAVDGDCAADLDVEITAAGTGTVALYVVGV